MRGFLPEVAGGSVWLVVSSSGCCCSRCLLTHASGISLHPQCLMSWGHRRPAPKHLWILECDILGRSSRMISAELSHSLNVSTSENKPQSQNHNNNSSLISQDCTLDSSDDCKQSCNSNYYTQMSQHILQLASCRWLLSWNVSPFSLENWLKYDFKSLIYSYNGVYLFLWQYSFIQAGLNDRHQRPTSLRWKKHNTTRTESCDALFFSS